MSSMTEKFNFEFHFMVINLNFNTQMYLMATVIDNGILIHTYLWINLFLVVVCLSVS